MTTLQAIGFNLMAGGSLGTLAMVAFGWVVSQRHEFIAPRCTARPKQVIYPGAIHNGVSKDDGSRRFNPVVDWIPWTLSLTYDTLLRGVPHTGTRRGGANGALLRVNLDAIVLLRFHALCLKLSALASVLFICVLLPMYLTGECHKVNKHNNSGDGDRNTEDSEDNDNFSPCPSNLTNYERTTLSNVAGSFEDGESGYDPGTTRDQNQSSSIRLYFAVFCFWIVQGYLLHLLKREWIEILALRRVYYLEADVWQDRQDELEQISTRPPNTSTKRLQQQQRSKQQSKQKSNNMKDNNSNHSSNNYSNNNNRMTQKTVSDVEVSDFWEENWTKQFTKEELAEEERRLLVRDPWIPHPEHRETVPNVQLYSVMVGGLPSLPPPIPEDSSGRSQTINSTYYSGDLVQHQGSEDASVAAAAAMAVSTRAVAEGDNDHNINNNNNVEASNPVPPALLSSQDPSFSSTFAKEGSDVEATGEEESHHVEQQQHRQPYAQQEALHHHQQQQQQTRTVDWHLALTAAFFDHCVPNQPGFSSSVAAVTVLPSSTAIASAWRKWYKAASRHRRLRFLRRAMDLKMQEQQQREDQQRLQQQQLSPPFAATTTSNYSPTQQPQHRMRDGMEYDSVPPSPVRQSYEEEGKRDELEEEKHEETDLVERQDPTPIPLITKVVGYEEEDEDETCRHNNKKHGVSKRRPPPPPLPPPPPPTENYDDVTIPLPAALAKRSPENEEEEKNMEHLERMNSNRNGSRQEDLEVPPPPPLPYDGDDAGNESNDDGDDDDFHSSSSHSLAEKQGPEEEEAEHQSGGSSITSDPQPPASLLEKDEGAYNDINDLEDPEQPQQRQEQIHGDIEHDPLETNEIKADVSRYRQQTRTDEEDSNYHTFRKAPPLHSKRNLAAKDVGNDSLVDIRSRATHYGNYEDDVVVPEPITQDYSRDDTTTRTPASNRENATIGSGTADDEDEEDVEDQNQKEDVEDQNHAFGPEQYAIYSREYAQAAAPCCPNGCCENAVYHCTLEELRLLEFEAVLEVRKANAELFMEQQKVKEINQFSHQPTPTSTSWVKPTLLPKDSQEKTESQQETTLQDAEDVPLSSPSTSLSDQTPRTSNLRERRKKKSSRSRHSLELGMEERLYRTTALYRKSSGEKPGRERSDDCEDDAESPVDRLNISLRSSRSTPRTHWDKVKHIVSSMQKELERGGSSRKRNGSTQRYLPAITGAWKWPTMDSILPKNTTETTTTSAANMLEDLIDLSRESTYAVVTFTSRQAAVAARQCLTDGRATGRWRAAHELPIPPLADSAACDLFMFRNCCRPVTMSIDERQKTQRHYAVLIGLVAFYVMSPFALSLFASILNPSTLERTLPKLFRWLQDRFGSGISEIVAGFLQSGLYTLFFALCPVFFKSLANFGSSASSVANAELKALQYYWWFMVVSAFWGTLIANMLLLGLNGGIGGGGLSDVLLEMARGIPSYTAATWLNWINLRTTFVMTAQYLLQMPTFFFSVLGMNCCSRLVRGGGPGPPAPYRLYVDSGVVLLSLLALAPASPLIAPAAFVYFLWTQPVLRRCVIFVYRPKFDGGGLRWPFVYDMAISSLLVGHILLTLQMVLKQATGPAVLASVPTLVTLLSYRSMKKQFLGAFTDAALLQTSLLDGWDAAERSSVEKREDFRQFLVDAHKAAYVPVCLAGPEKASLTAEPAVVVPIETDYEAETDGIENFEDDEDEEPKPLSPDKSNEHVEGKSASPQTVLQNSKAQYGAMLRRAAKTIKGLKEREIETTQSEMKGASAASQRPLDSLVEEP